VAKVDDSEVGEVRTMACEVRVVWTRREQRHGRAHNNEVGEAHTMVGEIRVV
jgi:hypothetical protein